MADLPKAGTKRRLLARAAKRQAAPGTAPGTVAPDPRALQPTIDVIAYGAGPVVEKTVAGPADLAEFVDKYPVVWVNVNGLGNAEIVQAIGRIFHLHPLALEDAINTYQRPKIDRFDTHDFIVVRMVNHISDAEIEQLSIFVGDRFVVTFQEAPGDCFDPVRDRIRRQHERFSGSGADYLAYTLIDASVDFYFPVLEHYGEQLDQLEEAVTMDVISQLPSKIHAVKRDLLVFRRNLWPLRDALNSLLRDSSPRFHADTFPYIRDCYDHTVQLIDLLETYRELTTDLTDLALSMMNKRLNEVMKVLTIISTLFIPMTFIASIYGMNFRHMPELNWPWGYAFALGLMALVGGGLLLFMRSRGWFDR